LSGRIKLTSEELGLMSLFQNTTGATARDCVLDPKAERIIFVVNKGEMGLAIGKGGSNIKNVQQIVGKEIELVEWSDDLRQFLMNALNPRMITEVRIVDRADGSKTATVVVDQKRKGAILGKAGRNAEKARMLAKRYFNVESIQIVSSQQ
jgi:transcription termination/antitermination protein NusA